MKRRRPLLFIVLCLVALSFPSMIFSQTMVPLPAHASVYSGLARGFWFIAPVNMTITGVMIAPEAGTGLQYIHVMKCNATFPVASGSASSSFNTLAYISGAPNNVVQPVNIQVQQGDQIGILGTVTGNANSYSSSSIITSSISGQQVFLNRLGYQGSIESLAAPTFWGNGDGTAGQIGRIQVYFTTAGRTDVGIDSLLSPVDSVCSGMSPITIRLKNHGPQPLISAQISWSINNNVQPNFTWSGNLPVNGMDTVVLGSYPFSGDTIYTVKAFTSNPNNFSDTANGNDTLIRTGLYIKSSARVVLTDTLKNICQGDTVWVTGTLTGIPPWNLVIKDGGTTIPIGPLTQSSLNIPLTPGTSRTYLITDILDGSGCINHSEYLFMVGVQPAPPATITPIGGAPAACAGDSVMLMGSVGLNFSYIWNKDGVPIPGGTSYLFAAKEPGNYTVKVTSPIGCSNLSAPLQVFIHPAPVVNLGNDTAMLPGQMVILNAGSGFNSYLWSTGATTQTINASSATVAVINFWVQVTDNNGCKGGDTIKINFTNHPGIEEYAKTMSVILIPNPASDLVEVVWNDLMDESLTLNVITLDGRKVLQQALNSPDGKILLDVSMLPAGNYLLQLSSARGNAMQRLVIVR